jgi:translation initiation factor 2 subunit 1
MDIRTYESLYPIVGNITIVSIKELTEMGVYVELLEYERSLGMLMMTEISRRRIRSLNKLIKIGKTEIVMVIRVDCEKGYIDVSKRQMAENEIYCMEKKWSYSKNINSITSYISRCTISNCEDLKIRWIWSLNRKYGHVIKGIKKIIRETFKTLIGLNISYLEQIKLLEILKKKIAQTSSVTSVEFEFFIFSKHGIILTKKIIEKQLEEFKGKKIEICLIVPPVYIIHIFDETKKAGIKIITSFLSNTLAYVKKKKGNLIVRKLILK